MNASASNASAKESIDLLSICKRAEWNQVEELLKLADLNSEILNAHDLQNGETPLFIAVRSEKLSIVERLIELGAQINKRACDGRTALHYAIQYNKQEQIVRFLLEKKADPTIIGGPKKQTPLHLAVTRPQGSHIVTNLLLRAQGKDIRLVEDSV